MKRVRSSRSRWVMLTVVALGLAAAAFAPSQTRVCDPSHPTEMQKRRRRRPAMRDAGLATQQDGSVEVDVPVVEQEDNVPDVLSLPLETLPLQESANTDMSGGPVMTEPPPRSCGCR